MPGDPALEVTPQALTGHAASLDRIGGTVRQAIGAAGGVRLGGQAYGQLCAAFPAMLEPLHDLAERVLREARDALDETADGVRAAAARYDGSDQRAAHRLGAPR
ncbi:type VII secretion target [Micromonospora olivasterospora]|uniref:Excreted virulence factor EspC (Type VII ESX diderm) n=1 Tax=Micromonospora olivasterospora TaxID=1880 RepID=A0A562ICK1_MICOL|nr:type VII secretion target [Micromonospora olivasterospora]TWH68642.1 excreted virulence factor EspC (type VII ESX diderm) [Micromonospora olivasterospora]